jgi:hypothetical protein
MSVKNMENPYTICVIYDKKNRQFQDFIEEFRKLAKGDNDILFVRRCRENTTEGKDQSYIACVKKYINDDYCQNEDFKTEKGIVIKRCHPNNSPIGNNMTWGFFIKTDKIDPQYIIDLFNRFEMAGFLLKDSYQIVFPKPYPNGDSRNYLIVTFEKNNGNYPRKFIRKLMILLNNSAHGDNILKINWLSNSVMKDILQGQNKELKEKK